LGAIVRVQVRVGAETYLRPGAIPPNPIFSGQLETPWPDTGGKAATSNRAVNRKWSVRGITAYRWFMAN